MRSSLKKVITIFIIISMAISMFSGVSADSLKPAKVENVILLIPDGMAVTPTTLARWYQGGTPLAMDEMASGLIRTYSSDAPIADSAPAGTAMATGYKSHTGYVGVLPDKANMPLVPPVAAEDAKKPIATILEGARLMGKATGLISTSEIMHATPADFSAHDESRKDYDDIGEQQVYQGVDVVLSGGYKYLTAEVRKDKEDMVGVIKSLGYEYITTPEQMKNTKSDKIWGMFAGSALAYDIDRDPSKEPSLAEMTEKAINVLSKDKDGFFLMVEGSKIDWTNHANDPVGSISDVLAFDKAVKVALDYAKSNKNTLVIAASDHGTGGMSIGNFNTNSTYDKTPLENFIDPLKKAKFTGEGIESKLKADKSNVVEVMKEYYGIEDLTAEEIAAIKATKVGSMNYTVGPMISKRANIGWTTTGHTGDEVVLYVYHPDKAEKLSGVVQNSDIALYMASSMGVDFDELNKKLFVNAAKAFEAKGAALELNKDNGTNLQLKVTKGNNKLVFFVNKNVVMHNGVAKKMPGVAVYNGIDFYVPQFGIDLLK